MDPELEEALEVVEHYLERRRSLRETMLKYLRTHLDELTITVGERRKIQLYPSDLSDARLVDLIRQ